jgi:hypothetical protein
MRFMGFPRRNINRGQRGETADSAALGRRCEDYAAGACEDGDCASGGRRWTGAKQQCRCSFNAEGSVRPVVRLSSEGSSCSRTGVDVWRLSQARAQSAQATLDVRKQKFSHQVPRNSPLRAGRCRVR